VVLLVAFDFALGRVWSTSTTVGFGAIAILGTVIVLVWFALPMFLLLHKYNAINWWTCGLAGILIGAVVAEIFFAPDLSNLDGLVRLSLAGGASALVFWAIWRTGRPAASERAMSSFADIRPKLMTALDPKRTWQ